MARQNFTVEKGLRISAENDDTTVVELLFGAAIPGSATQENNASVGSLYMRTGTAQVYQKDTAGSGTDKWTRLAFVTDVSGLRWRSERAVVTTNDATPVSLPASVSSFSDDDGGGPAVDNTGFVVGDFVIFDADGTTQATLLEVTATSGSDITVNTPVSAPALADNDAFVTKYYLPDSPAAQEGQALIVYEASTSAMLKIGDVNWDLATGINLSPSYTSGSGNPTAGDSVEAAIQKVDGNVDAIDTRQGLAQGALNFGSFTGGQNILQPNGTTKSLLQSIADEIDTYQEELATTSATIDSVLVDDYVGVEWLLWGSLDSSPSTVGLWRVMALHDGTTVADALNVAEDVEKIKLGGGFNPVVSVTLTGAAGTQAMNLVVTNGAAASFKSTRRHIIETIN